MEAGVMKKFENVCWITVVRRGAADIFSVTIGRGRDELADFLLLSFFPLSSWFVSDNSAPKWASVWTAYMHISSICEDKFKKRTDLKCALTRLQKGCSSVGRCCSERMAMLRWILNFTSTLSCKISDFLFPFLHRVCVCFHPGEALSAADMNTHIKDKKKFSSVPHSAKTRSSPRRAPRARHEKWAGKRVERKREGRAVVWAAFQPPSCLHETSRATQFGDCS